MSIVFQFVAVVDSPLTPDLEDRIEAQARERVSGMPVRVTSVSSWVESYRAENGKFIRTFKAEIKALAEP